MTDISYTALLQWAAGGPCRDSMARSRGECPCIPCTARRKLSDRRDPSPREKALRTYWDDYRASHGLWPTLDEAADHFGKSKTTVHAQLRGLQEKGWMSCTGRKARSWETV